MANPDVLIWPGREVITYGGHAIVLGETPDVIEYRVGDEGTTLGEIQQATFDDGALFGLAHPTIFPGDDGAELCRGCEFTLEDQIDLAQVDTYEVVNTSALLDGDFEPVGPGQGGFANPFVETAVDEWEGYLAEGYRITAVSGSDDKEGDHYGATATQVYAEQLSRPALIEALDAGHAYVQARGVADSPTLELTATGADGTTGMFGDTLVTDTAERERHRPGRRRPVAPGAPQRRGVRRRAGRRRRVHPDVHRRPNCRRRPPGHLLGHRDLRRRVDHHHRQPGVPRRRAAACGRASDAGADRVRGGQRRRGHHRSPRRGGVDAVVRHRRRRRASSSSASASPPTAAAGITADDAQTFGRIRPSGTDGRRLVPVGVGATVAELAVGVTAPAVQAPAGDAGAGDPRRR